VPLTSDPGGGTTAAAVGSEVTPAEAPPRPWGLAAGPGDLETDAQPQAPELQEVSIFTVVAPDQIHEVAPVQELPRHRSWRGITTVWTGAVLVVMGILGSLWCGNASAGSPGGAGLFLFILLTMVGVVRLVLGLTTLGRSLMG
jgi:hypothetical protein